MTRGNRQPLFWVTWPLGSMFGFVVLFFAAWILFDIAGGLAAIDLEVATEDPWVFAILLALAFGAGGAGLGIVQWLHVRRDIPRSATWIAGTAAGFVTVGLTYILIYESLGETTAEGFWGRLANETLHNIIGGLVAGTLMWRTVLSRAGIPASAWVPHMTLALVAAGLSAWATETAFHTASGDAAPIGILVLGIITAVVYRRLPLETAAVASAVLPDPGAPVPEEPSV